MTFQLGPLRGAAVSALLAAGLVAVVGCSDQPSDRTAATATSSAPAPEDQRTGDAAVAAGLQKILTLAKDIATAGTPGDAKALIAQIEPTWQQIEGTVKANDPDAYLALEDSFAQLDKAAEGDAVTAAKGAATVAATVAAYLAKHPG